MTIEETLLEKYGPLLSIAQLANVLDRSCEGLRISLRSTSQFAAGLNTAKIKLGRRVYFRTSQVADYLSGDAQ